MFAELFGRATGYCKGKGGSMHISNMALGMLGANGIVGGGPPIAIGAAFSQKYRKTKTRRGRVLRRRRIERRRRSTKRRTWRRSTSCPSVLVCENNGYGEFTPQANHQAIVDVADRAAGYGMPGVVVDGMDAMAVYEAAGEAIERARKGGGADVARMQNVSFLRPRRRPRHGPDLPHRRRGRRMAEARSDQVVRSASRRTGRADGEEGRGRARRSDASR